MMRLIEVEIEFPEGQRSNSSMGSVFHGAMMEKLSPDLAEHLHLEGRRPYSQAIYYDKSQQKSIWRLGFLNDDIYNAFSEQLQEGQEFYLCQKKYSIVCGASHLLAQQSCEEMADLIFLADQPPVGAEMQFLTTAGFKRQEQYVIFPETYLIFQSLLMKWNLFSETMKIEQDDLAKQLADVCQLAGYRLKSQSYSVEKQNIRGFYGNVQFKFHGNDMMNQILGLLVSYAPFAGIGIKTALGMGAVQTALRWREK